jgi:hypothetical protein
VVCRQASDKYHACFFHALYKREIDLVTVRSFLTDFLELMDKTAAQDRNIFDKNSTNEALPGMIKKWLESGKEKLPLQLWSPKAFKKCNILWIFFFSF